MIKVNAEEKQVVTIDEGTGEVDKKPTLAELSESGLTRQELDAAEKHGLTEKVEKPEAGKDPEKPKGKEKTPDEVGGEKKAEKIVTQADIQDAFRDVEKEKVLLKDYNKNEKGLYFKMKAERERRQASEIERDFLKTKLKAAEEKAAKALEATKKAAVEEEEEDIDELIDGKPKKKKKEVIENDEPSDQEKEDEKTKNARVLTSHLNRLNIEAQAQYEDFDEVMDLTSDILKNVDKIYENDSRMKSKVIAKCNQFLFATQNAAKYQEGEYGPADMGYEIGMMHPKYKKPDADGEVKQEKIGKKDGEEFTPEQLKKIKENAERRSSASVSGGAGKRVVSVEDITMDDVAKLSQAEYAKLPKHVRQKLLRQ